MKFLFLALGLIASNAMACPNLTGNYSCKIGSNSIEKQIENTETGYYIKSNGVEMEYATDGKAYEVPATDSYKDAKVISSCTGEKFIVDFTAAILYEGSVVAHQVSKTEYKMEGDQLVILQKTKMKGLPLPTQKIICNRY